MNPKEQSIITATARGIRRALDAMAQNDAAIYDAVLGDMQEPLSVPLSSELAGYYATMLIAWQERGSDV